MAFNAAGGTDPMTGKSQSVRFLGARINPTEVTLYFLSASVFLQVFLFISVGAAADYGGLRKRLLVVFTVLGSMATFSFLFLAQDGVWWLGGVLLILSNLFYGASSIFYNAFLPVLVTRVPEYVEAKRAGGSVQELRALAERRANSLSTHGYALGYLAGLVMLMICVAVLVVMDKSNSSTFPQPTFPLRLCIGISGAWWMGFAIITFVGVKTRPGPPLPAGLNYVTYGWTQLWSTLKIAHRLKNTYRYLVCYFFFSDGYGTVGSVGVLFGSDELGMTSGELILVAVLAPLFAGIGNYLLLFLQRRFGRSTMDMQVLSLIIIGTLPVYAALGFIPGCPLGLKHKWEMYLFACVYGLGIGAVQSFSRVQFAELLPLGKESQFFSLYAITDKGSSWLGPLLIGLIKRLTGNLRWGLLFLLIFIWAPIPVLVKGINVKEGHDQAQVWAEKDGEVSAGGSAGGEVALLSTSA